MLTDSVLFFFFKQKTAYEMRISDWSSDVCSSDLSLKLDPLDEEHRHRSLVPPHGVEKKILKILALIGHIGLLFLAAIPHRRSVCQTATSLWRHLYAANHPRRLGDRKSTRLNSSH